MGRGGRALKETKKEKQEFTASREKEHFNSFKKVSCAQERCRAAAGGRKQSLKTTFLR